MGHFSAWSPRVRKPPVYLGDTTLLWLRRSSKGFLKALKENKANNAYSFEATNLFIALGNALPNLYRIPQFSSQSVC
jgi:hypothetical protein